jgi:hypothetical protein
LIARSGWSHPPCEPLDVTIQREHVKPQFMPARNILLSLLHGSIIPNATAVSFRARRGMTLLWSS